MCESAEHCDCECTDYAIILDMNTKTFQSVVQQRMCYKLAFLRGKRAGHTMLDLNYEVCKVANALLIEAGLNHALWCRFYRNRVFMYHIATRRAVLELGLITDDTGKTDINGHRLYRGFELVLMGGIYNKPVRDNLNDYTTAQPLKQRENTQYATHHSSRR